MRKKLLAGVMALALCSTNMPLQTIFAGEANVMPATAEITEIDLNDTKSPLYSRDAWIISSAGSYRFNGNGKITHDPIIIKQSANNGNFYIYLNHLIDF